VRLADFSSLHRNEATGALGGLTRLRRFVQDDAHIFCAPEQVEAEVAAALDFVAAVYGMFGFRFRAVLSTRPPVFVGSEEGWARAEAALGRSLAAFLAARAGAGAPTPVPAVEAGGGAFYGPKIDVFVEDALRREHQCATVQLDFNLPERFDLSYADASGGASRPVMIHRAVLGSVERMLGVLAEHTAGRWPFWLSPRQLLVASVSERNAAAAAAAAAALAPPAAGAAALFVDVDASPRTVAKKVREAQTAQYNVVAVVGDAEQAAGTLALRFRDAATFADFAAAARAVLGDAACPPALLLAPAAAPAAVAVDDAAPPPAQPPALPVVSLTVADTRAVCEALARTPAPAPVPAPAP
jgi:threonyl-tRNA synthetase